LILAPPPSIRPPVLLFVVCFAALLLGAPVVPIVVGEALVIAFLFGRWFEVERRADYAVAVALEGTEHFIVETDRALREDDLDDEIRELAEVGLRHAHHALLELDRIAPKRVHRARRRGMKFGRRRT
jgi:hypothetical protein